MKAKCELLTETLSHVPNDRIIQLFKECRENFETLPSDQQILNYYRRNFKPVIKEDLKALPSSKGDLAYLRELKEKNPEYGPIWDAIIENPDNVDPEVARAAPRAVNQVLGKTKWR